jgi:hypothetical protein
VDSDATGAEPPDGTRSNKERLPSATAKTVTSSLPAFVTNSRSPASTTELWEGRCGEPDPLPPVEYALRRSRMPSSARPNTTTSLLSATFVCT